MTYRNSINRVHSTFRRVDTGPHVVEHGHVQHVHTPHGISDLIREHPVVIALFGRSDCPECEYVYQRLDRFARRRRDIVIRYVDLDSQPTLASLHVVHELPTTIVHVNGNQISKQVGGIDLPKLLRDIEHHYRPSPESGNSKDDAHGDPPDHGRNAEPSDTDADKGEHP